MNHLFLQRRARLDQLQRQRGLREKAGVKRPEASVFEQCPACGAAVAKRDLARALYVCPQCGHHHKIGAYLRLSMLLDPHTFQELDEHLVSTDPLQFPGYEEKLEGLRHKTGLTEGVVTARGKVNGRSVVAAVLDSSFIMGSMGIAVGEKVTRAVEYARRQKLPLIIFSASGGARMQEGILSLMQMAKTSAALARFSKTGKLYLSVLTHPTTGGVTASFASLGDVILAEPGALIGFAGPRVIRQTIGETLPPGLPRAVGPRAQLRDAIAQLLRRHEKGGRL